MLFRSEKFFDTLFKLPADILSDLIVNPERLMKQNGKIINIGIWNEAENGYIKIGFEFEETDGKQIVFVKGREWAVWQLNLHLQGEGN